MNTEAETAMKMRAYVAVSRKRSQHQSYEDVKVALVNLSKKSPNRLDCKYIIRLPLALWGGQDFIIPVDAISPYDLHNAVSMIASEVCGGETKTFVAASRSVDQSQIINDVWTNPKKGLIAINLHSKFAAQERPNAGEERSDESILREIRGFRKIAVADIVFGEYDIIAIYDASKYAPRKIVEELVDAHKEIEKTSTFLPYNRR